jgi:hypothetical protein
MSGSVTRSQPSPHPAPFEGAWPLGQAGRWLLLATSARQQPNGSWTYAYSVAPGITIRFTVLPGPGAPGLADPLWKDLIDGLTPAGGWAA